MDEVILFSVADDSSTICVEHLPRQESSTMDLEAALHSLFAPFGLIQDIMVFPSNWNEKYSHAFVKFYSITSAIQAMDGVNGLYVFGRELLVHRRKIRESQFFTGTLSMTQCIDLANHFIGFSNWCCRILSVLPEKDIKSEGLISQLPELRGLKASGPMEEIFKCEVELKIRMPTSPSFHIHACSYGIAKGNEILALKERARKAAVSNAYRVAFSRVAIIRLLPRASGEAEKIVVRPLPDPSLTIPIIPAQKVSKDSQKKLNR
jgi:hypothetical protein